jgi:hypothetical protein
MPDRVLARSSEGIDDFPYDSEHIEVESEIREYDLNDDEEGLPPAGLPTPRVEELRAQEVSPPAVPPLPAEPVKPLSSRKQEPAKAKPGAKRAGKRAAPPRSEKAARPAARVKRAGRTMVAKSRKAKRS